MSSEKQVILNKLDQELRRKSVDIKTAFDHISKTGEMLDDFLVPSKKMSFSNNGKVSLNYEGESMTLHRNAVNQIAGRLGVNAKDLQRESHGSEWERQAFTDRMNKYVENQPAKNYLVRRVAGEAKAFLSDRYRRLNTAMIFASFLEAAIESGSVLVDASHGELRDFLEVIHPEVIEIPTEKNGVIYTALGAQIRNSDFGTSKQELRIFNMNVVCLNGMVSKPMIENIHLGRKLEEVGNITFSAETMEADTKASALAVGDVMRSVYSVENLTRERRKIESAAEMEIDFVEEVKKLPQLGILKSESDLLSKLLMNADPADGIQGRNTVWKFSQGLTAVANKIESPDRKRDLQDIASSMVEEYVK